MAHKTMIDGVAYEISGGKTLVNGTAYSIKNGKTLVGGTAYEVGFGPSEATVTIAGNGFYSKGNDTRASVTIDGVVYNSGAVVTVPIGTVISLYTKSGSITLPDGSVVSSDCDYTVTTDIAIGLRLLTESSGSYNRVYGAIEVVENAIAFSLTYSMMGSTYELNCFAGVDMAWNEFISSGVHDASQFAVTDGVVQYKGNPFAGILTLNYNGTAVNATDLIVPAGAYTT